MESWNGATKPSTKTVVTKAFLRWCLYTFLGLILLAVDPFGLGSFAEEGSQQVLYELGGPFYESTARNDITIVLVSEQSLKALHHRQISGTNEWPLLYQDWAVILKTIAAHSPRALFVDVLFEQERVTDASLPALASALGRFDGQIPVFFAGGMPPYDSELLRRLDERANLGGSAWQGYGNGVPLVQDAQPMAAVQLYKEACGNGKSTLDGCNGDANWIEDTTEIPPAMSVVWGSTGALPLTPELEGHTAESFCSNNTTGFLDLGLALLKSALGDLWPDSWLKEGPQCLFHRVVDVDELFLVFDHGSAEEKAALRNAIENKIVLVGTWFNGLPDVVSTPTMGLAPGVALHAMMLDNLMKYGSGYVRTAGLGSVPYNVAVWAVIVLILVFWMARRESAEWSEPLIESDCDKPAFSGKDRTRFLFVSMVLTAFAALFTFCFFRLEPANAIGFLGLAELTRRIHGKWEESIVARWNSFRTWLKKFLTR